MKKTVLPTFNYEKKLIKKGFRLIAGVDEVGRGSFAGPVVAGCVVFDKDAPSKPEVKINDSKKLTSNAREKADKWIKENAVTWGIGETGVGAINKLGIKKATEMAFRRAIKDANERLNSQIDFLLIDAFYAPYVKGLRRKNQLPITKGDTKVMSIAAASIIAKVYRDRLMQRLARERKYKNYKWSENKGYGTLNHRSAIQKFGITRYHRKAFCRSFAKGLTSSVRVK